MKRREFIALVGGAAAWPLATHAQQRGGTIPRIGIIDDGPIWQPFKDGLREAGYVVGQTIAFETRTANGNPERLQAAAAELARRPVDVIATYGTPASRAAKAATSTVPIVMIAIGDPVRAGLVRSLARPGGNVTGNTILSPDLAPKRLQLVKEIIPSAARVALLWNPDNVSNVVKLPIETHELVAMIAPRGLLVLENPHQRQMSAPAGYAASAAGAEVYKALGVAGNISYHSNVAETAHCSYKQEYTELLERSISKFLKHETDEPGEIIVGAAGMTEPLANWKDWETPTLEADASWNTAD